MTIQRRLTRWHPRPPTIVRGSAGVGRWRMPPRTQPKPYPVKETIMSTISTGAVWREQVVGAMLAAAATAVKGWYCAYITWRLQRGAIAHLGALSDIGLSRGQIANAVKTGLAVDGRAAAGLF